MLKKITFFIIGFILMSCLFVSQTSAAPSAKAIYSMSISGNIDIKKADGYARVILTDKQGVKYLIYEAQGPFDSGSFSFEQSCEETCVLDGILPKSVDTEISGATIKISKIFTLEDRNGLENQVKQKGIKPYASYMDEAQEQIKIDKINEYIKKNNLNWIAGKTSISKLSFSVKRRVLGNPQNMPNLQGLEYYKGGVFEMNGGNKAKSAASLADSNLPRSFDWRNRHGQNWISPIKNQHPDFDISGCGSCWAFAHVGTIETTANLYFNKVLGLDLSEQDLVSCYGNGFGCDGMGYNDMEDSFKYTSRTGLISESCFPYTATNNSCSNKCSDYSNLIVKPSDITRITSDEEEIKKTIITKGPIDASGIMAIPDHAMVLVGYDTSTNYYPTWIFKNSWGKDWGEQGYLRSAALSYLSIEPILFYVNTPIQIIGQNKDITCEDKDNDGYCNWGISEIKPTTCPVSCKSKKDCDDSNKDIGPFDSNYNCSSSSPDTNPPIVGKIFPSPGPQEEFYKGTVYTFKVSVSDNKGVSGCELYVNDFPDFLGPEMILDAPYCKNCFASKEVFLGYTLGDMSLYAKCWDENGNIQKGETLIITISDTQLPIIQTITPISADTNKEVVFSTWVYGAQAPITRCSLYIYDNFVGNMDLSESQCASCTASIKHTFSIPGSFPTYAKCWDTSSNYNSGNPIDIIVDESSSSLPSVSKIQPTTASLNVSKLFSVHVSDNNRVMACGLKINNSVVEYMTLSENPCQDCDARINYTFTSKGDYSVRARCTDNEGNSVDSEPIIINIGTSCPDCAATHADFCENPPKCEKDCGADQQCDEKENSSGWISGSGSNSVCNSCSIGCRYSSNTNNNKPLNYRLIQNNCYSACDISCTSNGWWITFASAYCKVEQCGATKVSGNICYYNPNCGVNGCLYSGTDSNKQCDASICTNSGWDNSGCQGQYSKELYITEGFNNPHDYVSGYLFCDSNDLIVSGDCVPDDNNDKIIYNQQTGPSGWFCHFECNGWCTADGTIKITCKP